MEFGVYQATLVVSTSLYLLLTLELMCLLAYRVSLLNGTMLNTVDIIVKLHVEAKKILTDKC